MQQLQPNTTLQGGKYRIERVLGQGGFGNTYVGVNTTFDDKVAIKEFFMQGVNDRDENTGYVTVSLEGNRHQFEEQREKFKKEALRIRKLDNPHIVKVHDLFEENGTVYYVMDYVEGENLAERLKRIGKPMLEQEVRDILPQILDALKSVHDAGIWHLDLKPANILLDKSGNVKLIDFGASKQLNAQKGGATTSTAISYTNGYAPREQMEQNYDKFGPWTDIYALGATLYNLLTNKRPPLPTDIDDDETEDKHKSLPFSSYVSEEMRSFVFQLMHTHRMQRPQSINEVRALFDNPTSEIPNPENDKLLIDEETIVAFPNKAPRLDVGETKQAGLNIKIWWGTIIGVFSLLVIAGVIYLFSSNRGQQSTKSAETIDSVAVVEDVPANNMSGTSNTLIFGDFKYFYSGYFYNQKGKYPVKLTFKCFNGEIKECVYHNVKINKDIVMTGKIKDNKLEFYARDDNADFILSFSLDMAPSKLYGLANIGNIKMDVSYDLVKQSGLNDDFNNEELMDNTKNAYRKILSEMDKADADGSCYYFLYDITGDGIPELWVVAGTCEADKELYVYTYQDRLVKFFERGAFHSSYHIGNNCILEYMTHMGTTSCTKLYLSNQGVKEKVIYSGDYKDATEPSAGMYALNNYLPINSIR